MAEAESQFRYRGHFLAEVDRKNRLAIPHKFRTAFAERCNGKDLIIGRGLGPLRCLVAYDDTTDADWSARVGRLEGDALPDRGAIDRVQNLFATSKDYKLDGDGRIILLPGDRRLGGITRHVQFLGGRDHFEMWDPWAFLSRTDISQEMRETVESDLLNADLPLDGPPPGLTP